MTEYARNTTIRDGLLGLLLKRGLQPKEDWIEVQVFAAALHPRQFMYRVKIGDNPAHPILGELLRRITGRARIEENSVWVLSEDQMSVLLGDAADRLKRGPP